MKKNKVTTEQLLKAVKKGFTETREYTDKKIEDFLDIRLSERYEGVVIHRTQKKRPDLTVGDVVEVS